MDNLKITKTSDKTMLFCIFEVNDNCWVYLYNTYNPHSVDKDEVEDIDYFYNKAYPPYNA